MNPIEPHIESILLLGAKETKADYSVEAFCAVKPPDTPFWLHFSYENTEACSWIREKSGIDSLLAEPMLDRKVRPRAIIQGDALLLILRVSDTLDAAKHDELRSLRIYADRNKIISTSPFSLPVIRELTEAWRQREDKGTRVIDLFMELVVRSVKGLEVILEDLEDQADILERQVLDVGEDPEDRDIATLALDALDVRRCLVPQREVLARLAEAQIPWLEVQQKKRLKSMHERVSRQLDEAEVIRDRTRIIREQHDSHVAEQANQRLYVFSVAAAVFLPLSFLTGLLGVNLGGIPGAVSPMGFVSFCGLLFGLTLSMVVAFKRYRWL